MSARLANGVYRLEKKGYATGRDMPSTHLKRQTLDFYDAILINGKFRIHCLLAVANCAVDGASIFLHDYKFRHSYTTADKYFNTVKRANSAVVLMRRPHINRRALYIDMIAWLFDA